MSALFRFPNTTVEISPTQQIAVRNPTTGKFYYVLVSDLLTFVESGGYPSIGDDGTDVVIDANVEITGTIKASGLPTSDPLEDNALWLDTGVVTVSSGTP